jgi:hypothetical protein
VNSTAPHRGGKGKAEAAREEEQEWHHAFSLKLEALPLKYFPAKLAGSVSSAPRCEAGREKKFAHTPLTRCLQILFVGKSVRTLRRGVHSQGSLAVVDFHRPAHHQTTQTPFLFLVVHNWKIIRPAGRASNSEEPTLKLTDEEIDEFSADFAEIRQADTFHLLSLEVWLAALCLPPPTHHHHHTGGVARSSAAPA